MNRYFFTKTSHCGITVTDGRMAATAVTARNAAQCLVKPVGHGVGAETAGHADTKAGLEKDAIRATVDMAAPHFIGTAPLDGRVAPGHDGKPPRPEIDLDQGTPGNSVFNPTDKAC